MNRKTYSIFVMALLAISAGGAAVTWRARAQNQVAPAVTQASQGDDHSRSVAPSLPNTTGLSVKTGGQSLQDDALFRDTAAIPRDQRPPSVTCTTATSVIEFASPSVAEQIGLGYVEVKSQPLTHAITRNAEIAYNANRYARLSARAPGVIAQMHMDLGAHVRESDVIATVDSVALGTAKAEFLQATEAHKLAESTALREQSLADDNLVPLRQLQEAQTKFAEARIALAKARQQLRNLGLPVERIAEIEQTQDTSSLLNIVAPFDGIVVERRGVVGEGVEPMTPLISIANTGVMWAMIDLTESDAASARPGQNVTIAVDGLRGRTFAGRLTWISTELDARTRTIKARAELDNGSRLLKANMFGRARIATHANQSSITVPKDAVHWEGCCNIVFVKDNADGTRFQTRKVHLGFEDSGLFEVIEGLAEGDLVVTQGSFLLKTQILKDSIGAGCCEVDHLQK